MGEVGGLTRGVFGRRGLIIFGGLAAGGVVSATLATLAGSSTSQHDVDVLNFALAFEELQADFYARVSRASYLHGDWLRFAHVVGGHERSHVAFIRNALGAAAKPAPRFQLTRSPANLAEFQRMAIGLEDAGVALYNGQAANVTPKTLAAAAEIVSVEARHAAWARDLAGEMPAPAATDAAADAEQIKRELTKFGVRVA